MKPTLEHAILLAFKSHEGVLDRAGQPYLLHPLRVMLKLETETERIVGVLHDVVEDTRDKPNQVTLDDLRCIGYSGEVVEAIDCVTNRDGESYEDFVARAKANPIARKVKLADVEDNMDVRRLPTKLTETDLRRLEKYRRAWEILKQAQ
jgi:(p)ppGpp synthase/HD superfamily hydrolase